MKWPRAAAIQSKASYSHVKSGSMRTCRRHGHASGASTSEIHCTTFIRIKTSKASSGYRTLSAVCASKPGMVSGGAIVRLEGPLNATKNHQRSSRARTHSRRRGRSARSNVYSRRAAHSWAHRIDGGFSQRGFKLTDGRLSLLAHGHRCKDARINGRPCAGSGRVGEVAGHLHHRRLGPTSRKYRRSCGCGGPVQAVRSLSPAGCNRPRLRRTRSSSSVDYGAAAGRAARVRKTLASRSSTSRSSSAICRSSPVACSFKARR